MKNAWKTRILMLLCLGMGIGGGAMAAEEEKKEKGKIDENSMQKSDSPTTWIEMIESAKDLFHEIDLTDWIEKNRETIPDDRFTDDYNKERNLAEDYWKPLAEKYSLNTEVKRRVNAIVPLLFHKSEKDKNIEEAIDTRCIYIDPYIRGPYSHILAAVFLKNPYFDKYIKHVKDLDENFWKTSIGVLFKREFLKNMSQAFKKENGEDYLKKKQQITDEFRLLCALSTTPEYDHMIAPHMIAPFFVAYFYAMQTKKMDEFMSMLTKNPIIETTEWLINTGIEQQTKKQKRSIAGCD